jgi:hypothetical protein
MAEDQSRLNPELVEWLEERQKSLKIVKTTTSRGGLLVDWVPLESQVDGGKIAMPRPEDDRREFGARKEAAGDV